MNSMKRMATSRCFWWDVPTPDVAANPETNAVQVSGWPLDTQVELTINGDAATAVMEPASWDPNLMVGYFDLQGYDVQPGDMMTATAGGISKTLIVSGLQVNKVLWAS